MGRWGDVRMTVEGKDLFISFVFLVFSFRILGCSAQAVGRVLLSERSGTGCLFHLIRGKGIGLLALIQGYRRLLVVLDYWL